MEALLTITDVSERLKINRSTVWRLLDSGELRGFRIGRVWRVKEEDLAAYIEGLRGRGQGVIEGQN